MVAGVLLIAAFVVHALRTRHPLLDMRLFADRVFGACSAAMFLFAVAMFAVMILFPLYEQAARGLSALDAGLLMAPQGLAAMVAMPIAGKLTDCAGRARSCSSAWPRCCWARSPSRRSPPTPARRCWPSRSSRAASGWAS